MERSRLPAAHTLCWEEPMATRDGSTAKNVRCGMLQPSSRLCWCNTCASSAAGRLVEIKNTVESYCLFSKGEKKKAESTAEREGKGKAETWACKPVMEDKGRLCSTLLKPSMNKRLITAWSFSYETGFICSHHTSHRTKLFLFLQTSCSWCSDGNPYSRRDFFLPLKEITSLLKHTNVFR